MRLKWCILPPIFVAAFAAYGIAKAQVADPTMTIPVTGKIVENGLTYSFTGNITFPRPAPVISVSPGPAFCGLHDAAGNYLRAPLMGTEVSARGRDFGTTKGRVFWGTTEVVVSEWTDISIKFTIPNEPLNPRGHLLIIYRPDGAAISTKVGGA